MQPSIISTTNEMITREERSIARAKKVKYQKKASQVKELPDEDIILDEEDSHMSRNTPDKSSHSSPTTQKTSHKALCYVALFDWVL